VLTSDLPTVTREERKALHKARLEALTAATERANGGVALPVRKRAGWSAAIVPKHRDQDGSLLAEIRVNGPGLARQYVRRVRLVPRRSFTL
jgi:hypothetical protein